MAVQITEAGVQTEIAPASGKAFTLEELQANVGGYIERIDLGDGRRAMYVNEEGRLEGLGINNLASGIARRPIVGPALICSRAEEGE